MTMTVRIGLIDYGTDRPTIGITRYTQELIAALHASDVPVTVLRAGRTVPTNGLVPLWGAARAPGLLTLGQAEIAWHAWQRDLALVHDPSGIVPLYATRGRRLATIHDAIPYVYPETNTRLVWLLFHLWLPVAVRRLHRIITVSHHSKRDIVRYLRVNPERVSVVPQGVDAQYRSMDPKEVQTVLARNGIDGRYILYVSAVEPRKKRKNLPRLLEAFAQLRQWCDSWRLVIVGSVKKDYRPVFDTVERLGLAPYVHFTGFVDETDLPALYGGADLFVLPSLYEGFGLPVLEAMACGTPVVTSNVSSLPEVAGDAAIFVDPYDVNAIADAMRRILGDSDLAADLRRRGLVRAQAFSWERTARETIAVYEHVLGQKLV